MGSSSPPYSGGFPGKIARRSSETVPYPPGSALAKVLYVMVEPKQRKEGARMNSPATPPRTVLGREAKPEAPPSGPKRRRHAAMMVLLAILVLLWVLEAVLTRAGYLMPVPPIP